MNALQKEGKVPFRHFFPTEKKFSVTIMANQI